MTSPQRRPDDGPEGDLPPDPWAGLAPDPPPAPPQRPASPPAAEARGATDHSGDPSWHPAGSDVHTGASPKGRSLVGHPAVWIVLTLICVLALWAAWLDTPSSPPAEPSPGTLSTAPAALPVAS